MNKFVIAGGVAAVAFVAKLAYQKFFNKTQTLERQLVIKKLIDMRQYLYPILFEIADIVSTKLIPRGIPPDQAKMFIMESQQFAFKQNIANILQKNVYFDVDEEALQSAIQHAYKDDKEVQFYKRAFQQQYDKCFLGIKPQNLSTKMVVINTETLLKIVATLLQAKIQRLRQIMLDCNEELVKLGQFVTEQKKKQMLTERLSLELSRDESEDDRVRQQLLAKFKISDVKTFQFSIAKFLQESQSFKLRYQQLRQEFKKNVQSILTSAN